LGKAEVMSKKPEGARITQKALAKLQDRRRQTVEKREEAGNAQSKPKKATKRK
jgi:hypothetical protein